MEAQAGADAYPPAPWTFNHELMYCGFAFPLGAYVLMVAMWTYVFGHSSPIWSLVFWACLVAVILVCVLLATNSMHNIRRTPVVRDGELTLVYQGSSMYKMSA